MKAKNQIKDAGAALPATGAREAQYSPESPAYRGGGAIARHAASVTPQFERILQLTRRFGLTEREGQTLAHAVRGQTNRAIARAMDIAVGTVKLHLTHAYAKLRVTHRSQAITLLTRLMLDTGVDEDPDASWAPWFAGQGSTERRREGDVLFARADPGDRLYLLEQGTIALQDIGGEVRSGAILGEIAVLTPVRVRTCTAVCASDVQLRYLTREQARAHYFARPDFGYQMLRLITRRLMADRERAR